MKNNNNNNDRNNKSYLSCEHMSTHNYIINYIFPRLSLTHPKIIKYPFSFISSSFKIELIILNDYDYFGMKKKWFKPAI